MASAAGLLAVWLVTQVATADASWEARTEQAIALRLSGHEEEALTIFRAAEKERTSPRFFAQMAFAEQSLGYWVDADRHLEQALLTPSDAWIEKNRTVLLEAHETIRGHLGTLELRGDVRGELRVDGRRIDTYPSSAIVRLEVGRHRVEVSDAHAYPFQRDVDIRSKETSRETVALRARTPDLTGSAAESVPPSATAVVSGAPSTSSAGRAAGVVLLSVGAAAVATGIATLLVSNARASDYNANAACHGQPNDPPPCDSDASAARTFRAVSIASFVGAGITGAVGGFFFWRSLQSPRAASIQPVATGERFGLLVRGEF